MSSEDRPARNPQQDDDIAGVLGLGQTVHRRLWLWPVLIVAGVGLLAAVVAWQWYGSKTAQATRYKTATVERGKLTVSVTATGTLQPVTQVEVGSEISGTIKSVLVDHNDRVKKGQVLAQLETDQLQARVEQARASLSLAQASVREATATVNETRGNLRRSRELAKTGMCSQEECDAAEAAYARAEAALARAQAQVVEARAALDANRTTLAKATIRSPIDGIVLKRDVEPGQTVAASFQTPVLFLLAENLSQMELHVDIDEADVGQVKPGQQARFTVDAYPDRSFPATITDVHYAPQTIEGVVTYETLLAVDNSDLSLRPGMTATAEITVRTIQDALLVPNAALRFSPPPEKEGKASGGLVGAILPHRPHPQRNRETAGEQQVWSLVDGEPVAVAVTTGASDGSRTEITGGELEPGQAVIVDVQGGGR